MLTKKRTYNQISNNNTFEDITWGFCEKNKKRKLEDKKTEKNGTTNNHGIFVIGNEIHFSCGITKETIQEIINSISLLVHEHKENSSGIPEPLTITYIVDSPGGSVTAVLKFVDYLNIVRNKYNWVKFVSVISGMTASAGTIMSIVADERYMTEHAHAMVHELSAGNSSKYTELMSYMDYLYKLHSTLVNIYCKKTQLSVDEVEELLRKETWFSAQEYFEYGFVDGIKSAGCSEDSS
jgi:ATP-dependent protease ClpP protease subunit